MKTKPELRAYLVRGQYGAGSSFGTFVWATGSADAEGQALAEMRENSGDDDDAIDFCMLITEQIAHMQAFLNAGSA